MNEEKKIEFTQKWIGDAVKKFLQKEDIYESDMERIRYMRIGDCNLGGLYTIELSTAAPPNLFYTTDGGEEWDPDGKTVVTGRFIRLYIDYVKEKSCHYKKSDTGERFFQLPPYTVWKEFKEQYEGVYEEEYDEEDWDNSADEWESFEKTILCQTYREEFGDFDAYKE